MNIRPAQSADIAAIGKLAEEAELFPAELASELLRPSLEKAECEDVWLVAEDGDQLIGFVYSVPEKLTVGTYNMLPSEQRRKLAARASAARW